MNEIKCFFIGHRDAPQSIYPTLLEVVEKHITEYGVTNFIVGRYGSFDTLAAKAVIEAKLHRPTVRLTMLTPYHQVKRPVEKPKGFDDILYPNGLESVPLRYAIVHANRYMVENSEYLIAYAWKPGSNSAKLVKYATGKSRRHSIKVTNIKDAGDFEIN